MAISPKKVYTNLDNAHTGVVHLNNRDVFDLHTAGQWINAAGHTFGVVLSPDVDGARHLVTTDNNDEAVSRGVLRLTGIVPKPGKETTTPLYTGNLGKLAVRLFNIGEHLQIRLDEPRKQKPVSASVSALISTPIPATGAPEHYEVAAAEATAAEQAAAQADEFGDDDIPF